jgi:hypothetical protein
VPPPWRRRGAVLAPVIRDERTAVVVSVDPVAAASCGDRGAAVRAVHRGGSDLAPRGRGAAGRTSATTAGRSSSPDASWGTVSGSGSSSSATPQPSTAQMTSSSPSLTVFGWPDRLQRPQPAGTHGPGASRRTKPAAIAQASTEIDWGVMPKLLHLRRTNSPTSTLGLPRSRLPADSHEVVPLDLHLHDANTHWSTAAADQATDRRAARIEARPFGQVIWLQLSWGRINFRCTAGWRIPGRREGRRCPLAPLPDERADGRFDCRPPGGDCHLLHAHRR